MPSTCEERAADGDLGEYQRGQWPELPLDVLCSIAGRLPNVEHSVCESSSSACPAVLRLVCRDWCAMLDTSIAELKFGEEWPHLTRVVTRFPFLHTLDFSACTISWVHDADGPRGDLQEHAATDAVLGAGSGLRPTGLGAGSGSTKESCHVGNSAPQTDPSQAIITALQPLTQLLHLETLKVGYTLLKLLQQGGMGAAERENEYGFPKESPPFSPVSRLLSRLQASTKGNTGGNMDRMDGIDQVPTHLPSPTIQHSPRLTQLSHSHSLPDTRILDQDNGQAHSPSRAGGGAVGAVSGARSSRLRVATFSETDCRSPVSVSRAIFSSPSKTPRVQPPKLSPLDQFTQLLEKLTQLKELHVVIRETDNLAVYKLAPKCTTPHAAPLPGGPVSAVGVSESCMPMTLFNSLFAGTPTQSLDASGAAVADPPSQLSPAPSPLPSRHRRVISLPNVMGAGTNSSSLGAGHPLNAAFFSSSAAPSAQPSTPPSWSSQQRNAMISPGSPVSSPSLSPAPTPSIIPSNIPQESPLSDLPLPQAVYPQPTPPPSSPTTPTPPMYAHSRRGSQQLFASSPLSSSSPSPRRALPEAGPCVQLGRRLQLPASFGQLQLSLLFLRSQNLQILPACIGALTTVQELCLPANGLANLPYTMSRLQQLKALDLSDNRLRSSGLLLALSSLTPLQHLNLHRNRLLDTSFLHNLTQLHYLDLGSNKLKTLTHLANMSCLHTLDLSNNHLSVLPDEISTLVALDFLDVRRNRLSMLPACLGSLTALTYVNASHNYIRSVDASTLARLSRLQTLNLADNCLRDVPDTISGCSNLGHLNLSCNQLDSLPASISALTQLSSLVLNSNEVEELVLDNLPLLCNIEACDNYLMRVTLLRLPCLEHLKLSGNYLPQLQLGPFPKLRYLHLSANHLEQVELSSLPSLIFLDLSHNLLAEVPSGVSTLSALQLLFLSANRLSSVPPMLADLTQLTALHLDKNKLVEVCWTGGRSLLDLDLSKNRLQQVCVSGCPVLHTLSLARNELEASGLQLNALPEMQMLDLGKNKLGDIPGCVMELTSLRRLDLSYNQLPQLAEGLSKLTNLAELTLKDNMLLELPDVLATLEALTILDVASNPVISISPQLNRLTNLRQLYMRHISGRSLWTLDSPSPMAGGEPFSPSSQGPLSAVSSVSDLPPADLGDEASSQPALPLPPVEGVNNGVVLPADITQTVLADMTTINFAASRSGLPADTPEEAELNDGSLDRLLPVQTDSAAGDVSGMYAEPASEDPSLRNMEVQGDAGNTASRVNNGAGKGSLFNCLPDLSLSAVCCLPPIKAGSRDDLIQSSKILSECVASTSGCGNTTDCVPKGSRIIGMENGRKTSSPKAAAPATKSGDSADEHQLCHSCGACPDCLGRLLAMSQTWAPWDAHYTISLSTAPSLEFSYSVPSSSCHLPPSVSSPVKAKHYRNSSTSGDSAEPSAGDCFDLGRASSVESTCNTLSLKDIVAADLKDGHQHTQSFGSMCDGILEASKEPGYQPTHSINHLSAFSTASGSGVLPPLVPACSPAAATMPSGRDMQEWGETSVWLLLLQLFSLSSHEVPMPLPHALVSLEISNPACKMKVDRDVGILIARVLAKLTRASAQFMRSLERNSNAAASVPGGSFLHSHDFAVRLKTGYSALLRLVRRHYGLRLEALDLDAE